MKSLYAFVFLIGAASLLAAPATAEVDTSLLKAAVTIKAAGSQGSGFFVSQTEILTAAHVLGTQRTAEIVLSGGGPPLLGKVRTINEDCDVARIEVKGQNEVVLPVSSVAVGVSDPAYAIGSPIGSPVLSKGNVSFANDLRVETTVPVDFGSSGGPLLNDNSEVVGIVLKKSANGSAIAVPILYVQKCLAETRDGVPTAATTSARDPFLFLIMTFSLLSLALSVVALAISLRKRRPIVITLPTDNN